MFRLIPFELGKIWKKRSFLVAVTLLLLIHLFLLWYTSLPNEQTPPLSAYKKICAQLVSMSEEEKAKYIMDLKETIDGVCFVQDILAMQNFQNEMGNMFAEQEMERNPGVFEAYYDSYQSGNYLKFTDSLEQEKAFVDEIYAEWQKVYGYGDYLKSIQENKNVLSGISIFGVQEQNSYSARNLLKSAADYEDLTDETIRFMPSRGFTSAMQNIWTDILLFLSVMLFTGSLITEEKEKKLFFITRSTKNGILGSIGAKLLSLLVHCILVTVLFYFVSLVFFGQSTGGFPLNAGLQSVAAYMESTLSVSIFGYICLSVLTKAFLLFGIGTLLVIFCILSQIAALPFLIGSAVAGISMLMYSLIPASSPFAVLKYLNPAGLMKTENLYGGYLNFNLFGHPMSRLSLSLLLIVVFCIIGTAGSLWQFCRMQGFEMKKLRLPFALPFQPHINILRHETYKILFAGHGLFIFVLFFVLLGIQSFDQTYHPSVGERYYKDIMMRLEGEMTEEKEELVLSEKERYNQAFQTIEEINRLVDTGELSRDAADILKAEANMTLSFYPDFQRVEKQYRHIMENGGGFVYDTGYLYLFGAWQDVFSVYFLILSIGMILAVSRVMPVEYQTGAMFLLCATKTGKRKIFVRKLIVCIGMAVLLALVPVICRAVCIDSVYPMQSFGAGIQNISCFSDFAVNIPIGVFILGFVFSQVAAVIFTVFVTLALSVWRKNQVQTIFFGLVILGVPMILKLLGFEAAKWFSLYPIYGWSEIFLQGIL